MDTVVYKTEDEFPTSNNHLLIYNAKERFI